MGDEVISRVEAALSFSDEADQWCAQRACIEGSDLRTLLALARGNRETLHKLIVEAVGRYLHTNHGLEAEQIAGFVLDRLPSPPDTGE